MEGKEYDIPGHGFKAGLKLYTILAVEWAKYLARLAAYFVAPAIMVSYPQEAWQQTLAMLAILLVCVLQITPEMLSLRRDKPEGWQLGMWMFLAPVIGVALMLCSDIPFRVIGAAMWGAFHYMDMGSPPRVERYT